MIRFNEGILMENDPTVNWLFCEAPVHRMQSDHLDQDTEPVRSFRKPEGRL